MNKQAVIPIVIAALLLAACSQDSAQPLPPTSAVPEFGGTPGQASSTTAAAPTSAAPTTSTASTTTTSLARSTSPKQRGRSDGSVRRTQFRSAVRVGTLDEATRLAEIGGHEQRVVFRGGENGAPQAMWEDPDVQTLIKSSWMTALWTLSF